MGSTVDIMPKDLSLIHISSFNIGERVVHKTFGTGTLLSKKPMGGDTLLEINFDKVGVKKIMANFAKLTKE